MVSEGQTTGSSARDPAAWRELIEHAPAACFESDAHGTCTYVNRAWTELTGLSFEESMGLGWQMAVPEEHRQAVGRVHATGTASGRPYLDDFPVRTPDGQVRRLKASVRPLREDGAVTGWLGWIVDDTPRLRLLDELHEREALLQAVFDNSAAAMLVVDSGQRVTRANRRYCQWLGRDEADLVGSDALDAVDPAQREQSLRRFQAALAGDPPPPIERTLVTHDGREMTVWSAVGMIPDGDGRIRQVIITLSEFGDRLRHEQELEHLAHHDPLTGLPNRRALQEWARRQPAAAALLIDLDGFKEVNDGHGHHVGDRVLAEVADRLRHCVRESDLLCRFGGDEFLVLLCDARASTAAALEERIAAALGRPLRVEGRELHLSASIGVAQGTGGVDALAAAADTDLYRRKASSRPRHDR